LGQEWGLDKWVEIQPIDQESDRADALSFLQDEGVADETQVQLAISSPIWFQEFVQALQSRDPGLASRWKRRRSLRVIRAVEQWRAQNNVRGEIVYELDAAKRRTALTPENAKIQRRDELRQLIFEVLENLRTEELLEFRVPIGQAVAALRPELLRKL